MEAINIRVLEGELTVGTVEWVKNYLTGGALKVISLNDGSPGVQLILNGGEQEKEKLLAFIDGNDLSDSYICFGNGIWGVHPTNFGNKHIASIVTEYLSPTAYELLEKLVEHAIDLLNGAIRKEEVKYTFEFHS